jgi:hypothetical protein
MPYYRVFLEGRNFWIEIDESQQRLGFYTTRFVEAPSEDDAEKIGISLIRSDKRLNPRNHRNDPPRIDVSEIEEVDEADVPDLPPGYAFYPEDPEAIH